MILPPEAQPLLPALAPAFTAPTFDRFTALMTAAVLTPGRRTVANLLRLLGPLAAGHPTSYQRVSAAASGSGSGLLVGTLLARSVLRHLVPDGPVVRIGGDAVDGHKGRRVYGKARHRDPVRSTHGYTTGRYGHKWVVRAILVRLPFATRPWALPVLIDLYRSAEEDRGRGRPHRTPAELLCRLLRLLRIRCPARRFIVVAGAGYGTHPTARFCHRHRARLTLVSKFHPDANLYEPPAPYGGRGRPRVRGARVPKPRAAAQTGRRRRLTVPWYGGGTRRVEIVTGTGHWHKSGRGLVPVRWVFVHDLTGTHRDEYFFTTDPALPPAAVVGHYGRRWNTETTSQERRAHLGPETTGGWCRSTVLRVAPCLFGLYTAVVALYLALPPAKRSGSVSWPGKATATFADALTAVRRWLWADAIFAQGGGDRSVEKLSAPLRELIFSALAPAT
jgi:hypothetical protein